MATKKGYRDTVYMIKDVILTLSEYGELNQTSLVSFCGLNLKKHKWLLDELESKGMILKIEKKEGKRSTIIYKTTHIGLEFCRSILEPYEDIFPRKSKSSQAKNNFNSHLD